MIQILIGGDICPMGRIERAFIDGNINEIFHDLIEDISSADLSVANLECPLISRETPIPDKDAILGANVKCIKGFIKAKWDLLNLANNHSFDHGPKGLQETIRRIKDAGLGVVGAGSNIEKAGIPFIQEIHGERIVIYAMAEREFSIAERDKPGANPLDIINFIKAVHNYKDKGFFIVLIHGGKEFYPYPTPEMMRKCRFMIDMGADAVICCHSHCPLPWEIYRDKPIVYGLGNFIFEPFRMQEITWHQGYLVRLTIQDGRIYLDIIPYEQFKEFTGAKKMDAIESKTFLKEMQRKNTEIKDDIFINEQWLEYCQKQKNTYLSVLFGYNRFMRKLSGFFIRLYSRKDILRALLLVQCETHREILNTIFSIERHGKER